MTVAVAEPTHTKLAVAEPTRGRLHWTISDALTITRRNLIAYTRVPEAVFFSSVQPVMFVLLFRYVFGGAIHPAGVSYVNFLIPGIFMQTVAFGAIGTSIGLSEDLQKGLIERFRALPMARSAVLAGRTVADLCRNIVVAAVITGVGFAVGFRIGTNVLLFLAGIAILLLFAYTLSWGLAYVGLAAPNSETAQVMSFPLLFPLTFASSAFVPVNQMPHYLQDFAANQPFSIVVDTTRALMLGGPTSFLLLKCFAWLAAMLVVLVPLAVRKYRKAV